MCYGAVRSGSVRYLMIDVNKIWPKEVLEDIKKQIKDL